MMRLLAVLLGTFVLLVIASGLGAEAVAGEPLFETTDVYVGGQDGVHTYRIPCLVTTKKGTLLAICDARIPKYGDAPNKIHQVVKRSTDLGRTWSPMKTIVGFSGMQAAADPSVLADPVTGRVWVFYLYCPEGIGAHNSEPGFTERSTRSHVVWSDDDGLTWSKPYDISRQTKPAAWRNSWCGPGRGIRTRDGLLVVPFSGFENAERRTSHVIVSSDHGRTWSLSPAAGHATSEAQMVELNDGSWMLNMRNSRPGPREGFRQVAMSRDRGKTWTAQRSDTTLVEPACQASILRYTSTRDGDDKDRILFSNPGRGKGERWDMTIRLSYDEGKTWPVSKLVYDNRSSYSCLTILPDGTIGLLFEKGNKADTSKPHNVHRLTFVRCNLEWLTERKDALGKK